MLTEFQKKKRQKNELIQIRDANETSVVYS